MANVVFGNTASFEIPLTLRRLTNVNGVRQIIDADFIPNAAYPIELVFSCGAKSYKYNVSMRGHVACVELDGSLPVGSYSMTILCRDANGKPLRFKERGVVNIVDVTRDAGIDPGIEFQIETRHLEAAVNVVEANGQDGRGILKTEYKESDEDGGFNLLTVFYTDNTSETFRLKNGSGGGSHGINAVYDSQHERLVFPAGSVVVVNERLIIMQ